MASEIVGGTQFKVDFNSPVDVATLDASDLVIEGSLSATSVTLVEGHHAVFSFPALPQGTYIATIAAGAIQNTSQEGVDAVSHSFTLGAKAEYTIKQNPRLQLGDAPLQGFAGSEGDQIEILWQTVPGGGGSQDEFRVEYRLSGSGDPWTSATNVSQIVTGVDGRVVHSNPITGLLWDTDYDYRVRLLRAGVNVGTYEHTFHTRLPAGDTTAFSFVAYGDSAAGNASGFRSVQARINQVDPAFAVLLGDNIYSSGSHDEADARFDPLINPEAAEWMASHIDYLGLGNHDIETANGRPSEENFAVPIPVAGVNAPAEPPSSERSEHNFSWDYGSVHFVTFDTNALENPARLDGLLDYVVADLNASTAQWKIVYGHHPVAGVPDKSQSPDDYYYQQVVSRLTEAGADLFMVGHSHTYSWTYPLTGQIDGEATFVAGPYNDFQTGEGLPQLVSGVGGKSIRDDDYSKFPFVAAGFTTTSSVPAEDGFALIDVTPDRLTISYIAASDGHVIDFFTLTDGPDLEAPAVGLSTPQDNGPHDLDPADDLVLVATSQAEFQIQLSDRGDGINDATVVSGAVSVTKNEDLLSESVDYTFAYDSGSDTITLTPTGESFDDGTYTITLNAGGSQIADVAGNSMASSAITVVIDTVTAIPQTVTFQQSANGYAGTVDAFLRQVASNANNAAAKRISIDGSDAGGQVQGLLRFEDIIGGGANQIPIGSTIRSASLELHVTSAGHAIRLYRLLQDWEDTDTWNSLGSGIQANGIEASIAADAVTGPVLAGLLTIDVTAALTAWTDNPAANRGWALLPTGGNGVDFDSAEGMTPPRLVVEFLAPRPSKFAVVNATSINGGERNRSGIREVTFHFDRDTTVASPSSLNLFNHTTGKKVDPSAAALVDNGTASVTWDLTGVSLDDGYYTAELPASATTPRLGQTYTIAFHKLAGDVNGNTVVSFSDFAAVNANFAASGVAFGPGDANGDGTVSFSDYNRVSARFAQFVDLLEFDFGDAPDAATFSTTLAKDGARHVQTGNGLMLGTLRDAESDGPSSADARGDDIGNQADEEGVSFGSLIIGADAEVTVEAVVPAAAVLNGWVDFNRDGDWDDADEHVFIDEPISNGINRLILTVPPAALTGTTFARFRLTETAGYSYFGLAPHGEVEDYELNITDPPAAPLLLESLSAQTLPTSQPNTFEGTQPLESPELPRLSLFTTPAPPVEDPTSATGSAQTEPDFPTFTHGLIAPETVATDPFVEC